MSYVHAHYWATRARLLSPIPALTHPCPHASLAGAQAYAHGHATLVSELILPAVNEGCCAHKPNVRGGEGRGRGPFFECSL